MNKLNIRQNKQNLQIKTSSGFKKFESIKKTIAHVLCDVKFKSGKSILATPDHKIKKTKKKWIPIGELKINDKIFGNEIVESVDFINDHQEVFDIQGVEDIKEYNINNSLTVSNCAIIPSNIFDEFYSSIYPTISSGKESKFLMVSTVNGLNHFYSFWEDAINNRSDFQPFRVDWWDVPGRDLKWKEQTIKNMCGGNQSKFDREFGNDFFAGTANALIPKPLLQSLKLSSPLKASNEIKIYEFPKKDSFYIGIVDVAEGRGEDYSVLTIIRIEKNKIEEGDEDTLSEIKLATVALIYKTNTATIYEFTEALYGLAMNYNEAALLIEVNIHDIATTLYKEYDYSNVIKTTITNQKITSTFNRKPKKYGVKTTNPIKKLGIEMLIMLMEQQKFIPNDSEIIRQLSIPPKKNGTFGASTKKSPSGVTQADHDDIAMTIILFAWALTQDGFKEIFEIETFASEERKTYIEAIKENLGKVVFVSNGIDDNDHQNSLSQSQVELLMS